MRGCLYWSGTKEAGVKKNLGKVNFNIIGEFVSVWRTLFLTEIRIVIIVGIVNWLYNRSKRVYLEAR